MGKPFCKLAFISAHYLESNNKLLIKIHSDHPEAFLELMADCIRHQE
jgi:hypothetical protein